MNVNDLMVHDPACCQPSATLQEVARLMWENDCGAIPVVSEDNRPLGIITDRDIAMCAMHRYQPLWELRSSDLIQGQRLCCCQQSDSIDSCLAKMEQNAVRRILVTREDGTLAGIISMGDILAFTTSGKARGADRIGVESTLGMLKNVSAHHGDSAPRRPAVH